jgi:hypothetical protein
MAQGGVADASLLDGALARAAEIVRAMVGA